MERGRHCCTTQACCCNFDCEFAEANNFFLGERFGKKTRKVRLGLKLSMEMGVLFFFFFDFVIFFLFYLL